MTSINVWRESGHFDAYLGKLHSVFVVRVFIVDDHDDVRQAQVQVAGNTAAPTGELETGTAAAPEVVPVEPKRADACGTGDRAAHFYGFFTNFLYSLPQK